MSKTISEWEKSVRDAQKKQVPKSSLLIMSPKMYKRTGFVVGTDPIPPNSEITVSAYVDDDKIYAIDTEASRKPFETEWNIPTDAFTRFQESVASIASAFTGFYEKVWHSSLFTHISTFADTYAWRRFDDETIIEWGNRLSERNLLDDPAIRWEYQKTLWLEWFINPVKRAFLSVRAWVKWMIK